MEIVCKRIKPYICKCCNQEMLFFCTKNNMMLDYKMLLDKGYTIYELKKILQEKDVRCFKCITCNKTYIIDWSNGYPVPLLDHNKLESFALHP